MKKKLIYCFLVLLLTASAGPVVAQHYIGVRGGYGSGTSNLYPAQEKQSVWGLYNAGISWKYFTAEKVSGGIEVDLIWMQQGFSFEDKNRLVVDRDLNRGDSLIYGRKVNTLMMPLMWHPHFYFNRQKLRVFGNIGVTFSYNFKQTEWVKSPTQGKLFERKYEMRLIRDNRWGYGLAGGGGAGYSFDRWEVFAECRYYFGLSDIMKHKSKYPPNNFRRSPLMGLQLSVGVFYRLGKGGILSQPGARMAENMRLHEQKKAGRRAVAAESAGNISTEE